MLHCIGCVLGLMSRAQAELLSERCTLTSLAGEACCNCAGESYNSDIVLLTVQQSGLANRKEASFPAVEQGA